VTSAPPGARVPDPRTESAIDPRIVVAAYRGGARVANALPGPVADACAALGGAVAWRLAPGRRRLVERNLRRIHGPGLGRDGARAGSLAVFRSYARYWVESFRLPGTPDDHLDEGHDVVGYDHVARGLAAGRGVILVLPHLGGWEWSAFWLSRIMRVRVTAVVEPLRPPELADWFLGLRRSLGMHIVPLGPSAGTEVLAALRRNEIVCLLADRDLVGGGTPVTFFGEATTLPAGPATLALRSGAPLCPTAVYLGRGRRHHGVVLPPVDTTRTSSLRADVARVTAAVAEAFEELIRADPTQWHLMQPNWPSDRAADAECTQSGSD